MFQRLRAYTNTDININLNTVSGIVPHRYLSNVELYRREKSEKCIDIFILLDAKRTVWVLTAESTLNSHFLRALVNGNFAVLLKLDVKFSNCSQIHGHNMNLYVIPTALLYCIVVGSRRLMHPDSLQPKAYSTKPDL